MARDREVGREASHGGQEHHSSNVPSHPPLEAFMLPFHYFIFYILGREEVNFLFLYL